MVQYRGGHHIDITFEQVPGLGFFSRRSKSSRGGPPESARYALADVAWRAHGPQLSLLIHAGMLLRALRLARLQSVTWRLGSTYALACEKLKRERRCRSSNRNKKRLAVV